MAASQTSWARRSSWRLVYIGLAEKEEEEQRVCLSGGHIGASWLRCSLASDEAYVLCCKIEFMASLKVSICDKQPRVGASRLAIHSSWKSRKWSC